MGGDDIVGGSVPLVRVCCPLSVAAAWQEGTTVTLSETLGLEEGSGSSRDIPTGNKQSLSHPNCIIKRCK